MKPNIPFLIKGPLRDMYSDSPLNEKGSNLDPARTVLRFCYVCYILFYKKKLFLFQGVITKGTIIEVNISELGLVTAGGKVVWGKYAQVLLRANLLI